MALRYFERHDVRLTKSQTMAAFALTCAIASPAAFAQSANPWSFGAGIGYSRWVTSGGAVSNNLNASGTAVTALSLDHTDQAWKLFARYAQNPLISFEAGWVNLGTFDLSSPGASGRVRARNGLYGAAVITAPIANRLSLESKVGLYRMRTSLDGYGSQRETNVDLLGGVGLRYDVTRSVGLKAGWEAYGDIGTPATGTSGVHVWGLELLYKM